MSGKLNQEEVRHVAKLARLNISDDEVALFTEQLGSILEYVAQLDKVDTENIEPLAHALPIHNVLREDVVKPSLSNDEALANAPQRDGEFFAVPKVLGEGGA